MSNKIEELKKKQKELECNKAQLEKQLENVTEEIERLKNTRFSVSVAGTVTTIPNFFSESSVLAMAKQGNVFSTIEEAERESKKRALMFEFNEFRKERNGNWQPNWDVINGEPKHYIAMYKGDLSIYVTFGTNGFSPFGYFKHYGDCERAIEIFGARILELYGN